MTLHARWLDDITAEDYYADKVVEEPTLNYSTAALMINRSPRHAYLRHPKLGGQGGKSSAASEAGTILHNLILEGGRDIVELHFDDYRTKVAQAARDEALEVRKIPVLAPKLAPLADAALAFDRSLREFGIRLTGKSEATVYWQEMSHLGPVDCRGRMDHVVESTIYDIKTTAGSAHPDACARRIDERGYHIQSAAYTSALGRVCPELLGRISFVFLFFELEPPYAVTPLRPSGALRELGERHWTRAVDQWATCRRDNHWPGYLDEIGSVDPMPWALSRDLDQEAA